jgi:NADH-quinone oxidoreductase subunit J
MYDPTSSIFLLDFLNNFSGNLNFMNLVYQFSNVKTIAYALFNNYLYCFFFSGVILLLAMVGAIVLTLQKQFITKTQNVYVQILKDYNNSVVHYS